jgi:hypothetical protein
MQKRFYMKEGSPFQEFPTYVKQSPNRPRVLFIFIGVLILVAGGLAALFFLGANKKEDKIGASPLPTQMPKTSVSKEASPSAAVSTVPVTGKISPTPGKSFDRANLRVAILNGSGVAGAAKQISSYLNGLGYTIQTIGNADDFTYRNITVKIKKSKNEYLPQIKKDIEENSPNITILTSVDDKISADAEVIVGK